MRLRPRCRQACPRRISLVIRSAESWRSAGDLGAVARLFACAVVNVFWRQDRGAADRANAVARCAHTCRHQADARRSFLRLVMPPGSIADPDRLAERIATLFGHDLADQPSIVSDQLRALRQSDTSRSPARAPALSGADHDGRSRSDRAALGGSRVGQRDRRRALPGSVGCVAWITDQSHRVDKRLAS